MWPGMHDAGIESGDILWEMVWCGSVEFCVSANVAEVAE